MMQLSGLVTTLLYRYWSNMIESRIFYRSVDTMLQSSKSGLGISADFQGTDYIGVAS